MTTKVEQLIRQRASMYAIDPDVAVRVARSEGGLRDPFRRGMGPTPRSQAAGLGSTEHSFGPFQLYVSSIQIERLIRDQLPTAHVAQVQGNIWTTEGDRWDFISYCPKLPPFIKRVYRDDAYILRLAMKIEAFNEELALLVERIRAYGNPGEHLKSALFESLTTA